MELTRRNFIDGGIALAGAGLLGAMSAAQAGATEAADAAEKEEPQGQGASNPLKGTLAFHSICIVCKDIDSYTKFWTDFMGFKAMGMTEYPTPEEEITDQTGGMPAELCDDIFDDENHSLRVTFVLADGIAIELNSPSNVELTPADELGYKNTGMRELGFNVDDIDAWFKKVTDAGYYTTTDEPWTVTPGGLNRTFIFADPEGNYIQLTQADTFDKYWDFLAQFIQE